MERVDFFWRHSGALYNIKSNQAPHYFCYLFIIICYYFLFILDLKVLVKIWYWFLRKVLATEILVSQSLHREWTSYTFLCKSCVMSGNIAHAVTLYTISSLCSERSRRVSKLAQHPPSPITRDVRFSLITILTPSTRFI